MEKFFNIMTLPSKLEMTNILKRLGNRDNDLLYTKYAMIYYLYKELFTVNIETFNITSENIMHKIILYINSRPDLKELYYKLSEINIETFYNTLPNKHDLILIRSKLYILYAPIVSLKDYYIDHLDISSYNDIDLKHYTNSLYNDPLYYEPCIYFTKKYKYMYKLPFYCLSSIVILHKLIQSLHSRINSSVSLNSGISITIEYHEYNVINDIFYNLKTHSNVIDSIDLIIFAGRINMQSLVSAKYPNELLKQIYILTDVAIEQNYLLSTIYNELLFTSGFLFSEIMPYDLNKCKINSVSEYSYINAENKLDISDLIYKFGKKYQNNILFQITLPKNSFDILLSVKDHNNQTILNKIFIYWTSMGYIPSFLISRKIINVSLSKQDIENIYTNGILYYNNIVYYYQLTGFQCCHEYFLPTTVYLPKAFTINPNVIQLIFNRLTQTIFYSEEYKSILFSNMSSINGPIINNTLEFLNLNKITTTIDIDNFLREITSNTNLSFKKQKTICEYNDILLTELQFSVNLTLYLFASRNMDAVLFDIFNIVDNMILKLIKQDNLRDKKKAVIMFNLLNIYELCSQII